MNNDRWKFRPLFAILLLSCLVSGCLDSSEDDDDDDEELKPTLGAFHAVSDMGTITVITADDDEETVWADLEFSNSVRSSVNDGTIDFRFETALPSDDTDSCQGDEDEDGVKDDDECTHIATGSVDISNDTEYMVVLYGSFDSPEVLQYEKPMHEFDTEDEDEDGDAEDENMEVWFFHLVEGLGEVDVYLEEPGTSLSAVQVRDTLSPTESFNALVDEGEYVLTLTEVADPSAVLFTSEAFTLSAQTRVGFAIREGAGEGTSPVKVTLFRDLNKTLLDRNATTELRFAHTVPEGENIDVFVGNDFTESFVGDLSFGESSDYGEIAPSALTNLSVDITPTDSAGMFLARKELDLTQGEQATYYFVGESSDWNGVKISDGVRRLATHAQFRLVNGADSELDYYVVEENDNISTLSPTESLSFRENSGWNRYDPGTYDIVVTEGDTDNVVYSDTVELSEGGIYTLVTTNNAADPTAADAVLLDDFAAD